MATLFELPPLPYPLNALEPHTSAKTLEIHHGKHHQAYVTNLNAALAGAGMEAYSGKSLEEVVRHSFAAEKGAGPVFNNSSQVWNHSFFWRCMKPGGGGSPGPKTSAALVASFGSVDKFAADFKAAALAQFGSGWAWLALDADGKTLKIVKTPNAESPIVHGMTPLLTCDVWEHAYYLDYQNRRPDFVTTFLASLVNWDFVEANLAAAAK
jgi:Fe-Mn family superoxide dismutase